MRAKVPQAPEQLAKQVTQFVQELRRAELYKLPGIAETLDWITALVALDQAALDERIVDETLGVIPKYQDDVVQARAELRQQVETFVFSTRLTRITRPLRQRSVDRALRDVSRAMTDWSGGARIGEALKTFNYQWVRRVMCSSAVVLIISDGWDRCARRRRPAKSLSSPPARWSSTGIICRC